MRKPQDTFNVRLYGIDFEVTVEIFKPSCLASFLNCGSLAFSAKSQPSQPSPCSQ